MARSILCAVLTIAGLIAATPAHAQFPNIFDSIFGNPPPRPPSDVPDRPPSRSPQQPQYVPPGGGGLPPGPPPSSRIQTQPLLPPPGGGRAPQQAAPGAPPGAPGAPPPGGAKPLPQPASLPPTNETIVEPPPHKIANPTAVFSGLDKITGRIISFDVAINETVRFGALEVTPRACYSRPPTEAPSTDGFIEVDELTLQGEIKRIFSGWMFAASPGLNAVEHSIYDVWLTDCKGAPQPVAEAPAAPPPPTQRTPAPRTQQLQRPPGQPGQPAPPLPQQRATQQLPPPPAPLPR
jgi:hypothetical protein